MEQCKALMPVYSSTLLTNLINSFAVNAFNPVIVVVGGRWQADITKAVASISAVTVIANPDPSRGMFSSLQTGLAMALENDVQSVAFTPVDVPLRGPETVAQFVEKCQSNAPIQLAGFNNQAGHPALVSASVAQTMVSAPTDSHARQVMAQWDQTIINVQDPGVCVSLNTQTEFEAWQRKKE